MSPSAAFNFGTSDPDPSFELKHIPYSSQHWPSINRDEELPLHYMSEEKARRRVKVASGSMLGEYDQQEKERYSEYYDDEGKDVYSKIRPKGSHLGSGRLPRPPLPPPTSVVCCPFLFF